MEHLMIDLETLGTRSNSVFLSLAAVQFNLNTGFVGKVFRENITLDSSLQAGLTVDASTIKWWLEQRTEIMKLMFVRPAHIHNVLVSFSDFIQENEIKFVWGNSARFDLGLLDNAYNKVGVELPWKFWNELDFRTMKNLFPQFIVDSADKNKEHDPLYDCEKQIKILHSIWTNINPKQHA